MAGSTRKRTKRAATRRPRAEAVIDTGVLVEATTVHDVFLDGGKQPARARRPDHYSAEARKLRLRVRRDLLLLDDLNAREAATFYVGSEAERLFERLVPPKGTDLSGSYTTFHGHFFLKALFWGWKAIRDDPGAEKSGDDYVAHLVGLAARRKIPVITNETRATGAVRREAARMGVQALTPGDYRAQFLTENAAIDRMMDNWEFSEEAFFERARKACRDRAKAIEYFRKVDGYLTNIMLDTARAEWPLDSGG